MDNTGMTTYVYNINIQLPKPACLIVQIDWSFVK